MKRQIFALLGVILILTVALMRDGLCQQCQPAFYKPYIQIVNVKHHPTLGNGTFFYIDAQSIYANAMNNVKKMTAVNADSSIDGTVYEFPLTPTTRLMVGDYQSINEFTGQYGQYVVTVEKSDGSTVTLNCDFLPQDFILIPHPTNLRVTFESGPTTPTFSLDPAPPDVDFNLYGIRIYDKDFSRIIYRTSIPSGVQPTVTFPYNRAGPQTAEDFIPGETYIFNASIVKYLPGNSNLVSGTTFISFKIPKH